MDSDPEDSYEKTIEALDLSVCRGMGNGIQGKKGD